MTSAYETCFNESRQAVLRGLRTKADLPRGTFVQTVQDRIWLLHPEFPPAQTRPYERGDSGVGDRLANEGLDLCTMTVPEVTQRDDGAIVFDDGFTVLADGSTTHERSEA